MQERADSRKALAVEVTTSAPEGKEGEAPKEDQGLGHLQTSRVCKLLGGLPRMNSTRHRRYVLRLGDFMRQPRNR